MDYRSKIYWVEVWENRKAKIVPHTPKKNHYKFLSRSAATSFKDELVLNNPKSKFRVCKQTTTLSKEGWCTVNKRIRKAASLIQ